MYQIGTVKILIKMFIYKVLYLNVLNIVVNKSYKKAAVNHNYKRFDWLIFRHTHKVFFYEDVRNILIKRLGAWL